MKPNAPTSITGVCVATKVSDLGEALSWACLRVGDLSVGADVGGDGFVGEFAVGGLGEGTVGGWVDGLDLADVGIVGC